MPTRLQICKKRERGSIKAVKDSLITTSHRLFLTDRASGTQFLVDTGAYLSVFPRSRIKTNVTPVGYQLYTATNAIIETYGRHMLTLDFGLRREFTWCFVIADVTKPLIGADFISHFGLLVDLKNKQICDENSGITSQGLVRNVSHIMSIKVIPNQSPYNALLREFPAIIKPNGAFQFVKHTAVHHIKTTQGPPVSSKARRLAPHKLKVAKEEFAKMLKLGIARPSQSPWSSPLHLAPKKNGESRPCGDYRRLNDRTVPDRYPVRYLEDFGANLYKKTIFSTIDLVRAFNQIPVAEQDIEKTAIITPFGLFEFPFMTFGLRNAAQTFQRFMDEITRDLPFVFPYIDDLLVASDDEPQHLTHLKTLFQSLEHYGLVINNAKSFFGQSEAKFLDHHISSDGIKPLPEKVSAIRQLTSPITVKKLRGFIGMVNFYGKFIKNAAELLGPLNEALAGPSVKGSHPVTWTKALKDSFEQSKEALANSAQLAHPNTNAELAIFTDASNTAIGAVLQQRSNNSWQPLAFFSRTLPESIRKLSTYDRELHAIYDAVKYFRYMFEGRHIVIYTDHKPLQYVFKQTSGRATPWQFRRIDFIGQFTTEIKHLSGQNNIVADTLSRIETISAPVTAQQLADAQKGDAELQQLIANPNSTLQLKNLHFPEHNTTLYCDVSSGTVRPFVAASLRRAVFDSLHSLSHPGIRCSQKLLTSRYIWPSINKNCREWARSCIDCQRNKIQRYVVTTPARFQLPSQRFEHIHVDLITLPSSNGFRQCLTIIDRFTRFPEAIPLKNGNTETIAHAIIHHWIARYGVPLRITSDRGGQFESDLFRQLSRFFAISHLKTTPYHPQANGLIERLHRQLKSALLCHNNTWYDALPIVLLGLRASWKNDISTTPAELVYGEPVRLPGEFINPANKQQPTHDLLKFLRNRFHSLTPADMSRHGKRSIFRFRELDTCSHVLIRQGQIGPSFSAPYQGPYRVISRHDKYFCVDIRGQHTSISVDRLKPVYEIHNEPSAETSSDSTTTKSTRRVHFADNV